MKNVPLPVILNLFQDPYDRSSVREACVLVRLANLIIRAHKP